MLEMIAAGDRISDRLAIHDCVNLNAVATDLLDAEAWKATYWPDAEEDHGWSFGNAHKFIDDTIIWALKTMDATWHQLSNTIVAFDDEYARVVTYYYAYCRMISDDGGRSDSFCGGRYIDRFEKRSGQWKIKLRITKPDWIRAEPDSFAWGTEIIPGFSPKLGNRDQQDPGRILLSEARLVAAGPHGVGP